MTADLLLAVPALALVSLLGVVPAVTLLKQKYILFVIGLVLLALGFTIFGSSSPPESLVGGIGLVVWVAAAVRLAPPASRWARQLYGPEKLARARARPAGLATPAAHEVDGDVRAAPDAAGAPPRSVTVAATLTGAGTVAMGGALGSAGVVAAGTVWPVLWLVRAGWRRGRTMAAVIGALAAAVAVAVLVTGGAALAGWIYLVVAALLFAGGLVLLYRDPVDAYLRAAPP